jgi:predicted HTH domain antitoxin
MHLSIPESIIQSIRLPKNRIEAELLKELALALCTQELLAFDKARELANLDHRQFSQLLGERNITSRLSLQKDDQPFVPSYRLSSYF